MSAEGVGGGRQVLETGKIRLVTGLLRRENSVPLGKSYRGVFGQGGKFCLGYL